MTDRTRSPHHDSMPNHVTVDGQPLYGEVSDPPPADCASPDCGRPLTRDEDGLDRFGDKEPFIEGCHFGCFIPDTSDPDWAGYIGPDTDVTAFLRREPDRQAHRREPTADAGCAPSASRRAWPRVPDLGALDHPRLRWRPYDGRGLPTARHPHQQQERRRAMTNDTNIVADALEDARRAWDRWQDAWTNVQQAMRAADLSTARIEAYRVGTGYDEGRDQSLEGWLDEIEEDLQ